MVENLKRDLETEKRLHDLMDRSFEYIGIKIPQNKYPQVYIGDLNRGGRYNSSKNQVYLNKEADYSGDTIGEEAIGHFVRDQLPDNKLKSFLRRAKRKVFKKSKYDFEDHYVGEFFGYLGRRILKEVATPKDRLTFDDDFSSNKVVVNSLRANKKEKEALLELPKEGLSPKERKARIKKIRQLDEERIDDLTHYRPYHFASQVDINKLNLPNLYKMSNKEVRRRFFRENPIYDSNLEQKVELATTIVVLLNSIFFLSSNFTGYVISNLSLKSSNIIGVVLFLAGIVGALFYLSRR